MNRRAVLSFAALAASAALLISGCSSSPAESSGPPRTVNVSATGSTEVAPDAAKASLTVSTANASSASSAQRATAEATVKVVDAVKKAGVDAADIATQSISVSPVYRYSSTGSQSLDGYQATQSITVTLRDLTTAGATLDAIVTAGGNAVSIDSVSTYVSDPAAASQKARAQAVDVARAQAQQYAELLGFSLGPVASVNETSSNAPAPIAMADAVGGEKVSTPIEPGTTKVSVTLDVSWLIED
ncbi:MAG: SIMPL domain-containing protein [Actinomycetota bacterium]|nr:SIMPL domain-containing protein [Actinomycetota bacterium]MDP2287637.1 SIMPL domain-containing protein [Actinomycetota bacterium]